MNLTTIWNLPSETPFNLNEKLNLILGNDNCQYLYQILCNKNLNGDDKKLNSLFFPPSHFSLQSSLKETINPQIALLKKAINHQQKIVIWGNLTTDSVTGVYLLKKGLINLFPSDTYLNCYFNPRNSYYFGLNKNVITIMASRGIKLIITVALGSNFSQDYFDFIHSLGMDLIIIHPLVYLNSSLSLNNLNSVVKFNKDCYYFLSAVVYGYILLMNLSLNNNSVSDLFSLVAIGILAEKSSVLGYNRYLLKEGLKQLKNTENILISHLINYCKQKGDRPSDIDWGIGKIIEGIISVSQDEKLIDNILNFSKENRIKKNSYCEDAVEGFKNYLNYLSLTDKTVNEARKQIKYLDLSYPQIIVLYDKNWEIGILKNVAQILVKEISFPVILLSSKENNNDKDNIFYQGYGYGLPSVNLNELVMNQKDLLEDVLMDYQGVKLSINQQNLRLFKDRINRETKTKYNLDSFVNIINIDLVVTVKDLGESLEKELKLIEPFSIDNTSPNLLIKNCNVINFINKKHFYFKNSFTHHYENKQLHFYINDGTISKNFLCIYWGDFLFNFQSNQTYDVVIQLKSYYNSDSKNNDTKYYGQVIDLKIHNQENFNYLPTKNNINIIDYRQKNINESHVHSSGYSITKCPDNWDEITLNYQDAIAQNQPLILAYQRKLEKEVERLWHEWINILKNSVKNGDLLNVKTIEENLDISLNSLKKLLQDLRLLNINYQEKDSLILLTQIEEKFSDKNYLKYRDNFKDIISQEKLQKEYFYQVKIEYLKKELVPKNSIY